MTAGTSSSAAASRRSTCAGSSVGGVGLGLDEALVQAVQPGEQRVEVVVGDDRGMHAAVGDHRDVVDREDVGGVHHRHEQAAVLAPADRHGLQAARDGGVDEVRGRHVHLEGVQAHVVEREAVRDGARELVARDDVRVQQDLAHRLAELAAAGDRALDHLAGREAELDDHVAEQAPGAWAPGRLDRCGCRCGLAGRAHHPSYRQGASKLARGRLGLAREGPLNTGSSRGRSGSPGGDLASVTSMRRPSMVSSPIWLSNHGPSVISQPIRGGRTPARRASRRVIAVTWRDCAIFTSPAPTC